MIVRPWTGVCVDLVRVVPGGKGVGRGGALDRVDILLVVARPGSLVWLRRYSATCKGRRRPSERGAHVVRARARVCILCFHLCAASHGVRRGLLADGVLALLVCTRTRVGVLCVVCVSAGERRSRGIRPGCPVLLRVVCARSRRVLGAVCRRSACQTVSRRLLADSVFSLVVCSGARVRVLCVDPRPAREAECGSFQRTFRSCICAGSRSRHV